MPSRFKYAQIFAKFSKPLFKQNWRCEIFLNWGLKKESSPMCCPRFTHGFPHNFQPVRSSRSISYSLRTNKYMIEGLKYIDLCTVKMMHYNILGLSSKVAIKVKCSLDQNFLQAAILSRQLVPCIRIRG